MVNKFNVQFNVMLSSISNKEPFFFVIQQFGASQFLHRFSYFCVDNNSQTDLLLHPLHTCTETFYVDIKYRDLHACGSVV